MAYREKGKETHPQKGVMESFPILEFNAAHMRPPHMVVSWMRALENFTKAESGPFGYIFEMKQARAQYPGKHGGPAVQEPQSWREKEFARLQIQAYAEVHKHTRLTREKICGLMVGQLSRTSLGILEMKNIRKDLTTDRTDPLERKKAILVMHMTPVGASDIKRKMFTRACFQKTVMGNGESIGHFRERFSDSVIVMAVTQKAMMEEERINEGFSTKVRRSCVNCCPH
ncbi:hypothetical protein FVE85_3477 [Porphyridium purpureum]|uniref:Uncharacterized protein n=1 Tax=Porphyridium purpureum TaxID=35688 RepID=A0A5J4YKP2_PORPP|nr:hypothetical protein FVE85_3477 [Porphyridium purpureum]|eukprot:POR4699..scf249_10